MISIFFNLLRCVLYLTDDLSWRMFYVHLRKMYILLLFGGKFCICLLGPFGLQCYVSCLLIDFLPILSIFQRGLLKSPIILLLSVFPFKSVNMCFIYLGALMLGIYLPVYVISYHYIMTFFVYSDNF